MLEIWKEDYLLLKYWKIHRSGKWKTYSDPISGRHHFLNDAYRIQLERDKVEFERELDKLFKEEINDNE